MPFTDKDRHLIKAFQKETHDTASQLFNKIHVQTNTESVQCLPVTYHKSNESWCLDIKTGLHSKFILTRIRSLECGIGPIAAVAPYYYHGHLTLAMFLSRIFFTGHVSTFLGAYIPN